jgi:hypothetical protein
MAAQMRKYRRPRRRHRAGDQGVEHYGRLLISDITVAECARQHTGRKRDQSRRADDAEIDLVQGQIHPAETLEQVVMG